MLFTYCLPVLLCLNQKVTATGRRPRFEPLPVCSGCVPREDILAPGIGFDLTTSYATAAIRFHNGSVESLLKVDADDEYKQMMIRVTDPMSKSKCRPGNWSIACSIESTKRRMNKLLGRPSTPTVGTIASLIHRLLSAQEKVNPLRITRALVTVPDAPGLTHADLEDAMEYLGLTLISTHKHIPSTVSELSAAYAGSNMGLCTHYADIDTCEDEDADMPIAHILALSLTQHSFSAAYSYMSAAYRSILEASRTHFDLGLEHLSSELGSDYSELGAQAVYPAASYWSGISDVIVEIGHASLRPLTTLLLLGEDAENPEFVRTVQDALRKLLPEASSQEIAAMMVFEQTGARSGAILDPLYLAARGAAEFAKRAQEAPAGCVERARCAKNRISDEEECRSSDEIGRDGEGEREGEMDDREPLEGLEAMDEGMELRKV